MVSSGHNSLDIQLYVKLKPLCINLWCKLINNYRKIIFFPKNRSGLHVVVICILLFLFKRDVCPNSTILFKILSDKKIAEDLSRFFYLETCFILEISFIVVFKADLSQLLTWFRLCTSYMPFSRKRLKLLSIILHSPFKIWFLFLSTWRSHCINNLCIMHCWKSIFLSYLNVCQRERERTRDGVILTRPV